MTANRGILPVKAVETINQKDYLTLTISKNPDARNLAFLIEHSEDLAKWHSVEGLAEVFAHDPEMIKIGLPLSEASGPFHFLRLRVTSEK